MGGLAVANRAVVYVTTMGATGWLQVLNGILETEQQIGFMADRILYTEGQIGEMANRIVYVTEYSQYNFLIGMYMEVGLFYAGMSGGMEMYRVTLQPVSSLPFPT